MPDHPDPTEWVDRCGDALYRFARQRGRDALRREDRRTTGLSFTELRALREMRQRETQS